MKTKPTTIFIYALMALLTFGYTCLIRLGLGIFNILYDPKQMGELNTFSRLTAGLGMVDIWQYLAWGSLLTGLIWGSIRARRGDAAEPHMLPWVCHLTFILAAFFLNSTGALSPLVVPAYVIR